MDSGSKVLITGATGQVAFPVAIALAVEHQVTAIARFRDTAKREALEARGVECVEVDLAKADFAKVSTDFDYVANFAVLKSGKWDLDVNLYAESISLLMEHTRSAKAFLHCSSTGVYQPAGAHELKESDPLGDNHRAMMPTYSISKIAAEVMVRYSARRFSIPTTIARLNVPYGDEGGWPAFHLAMMRAGQPIPVHADRPNLFNPIHHDDIARMVPALLDSASLPTTIVNWGGDETVSLEEWCELLASEAGCVPTFIETDSTIGGVRVDLTRMHELVGHTKIDWREGMRRLVASHPA
ncbi:nucleoside-diphosphate-sugar epimerase [Actinobacteria bacterium IMCC26256]|nr:nucleoside-diphosphate-sugar epimerase [Actinobacteria bacterium IMCC26256]